MISIKTHHANGQPKTFAEMIAELDQAVEQGREDRGCLFPAPPVTTVDWLARDWERYVDGACVLHNHNTPHRVNSADTGDVLQGRPSPDLIRESEAAGDTGTVPAYMDGDEVWQYVPPSQVETYRKHLGHDVVTVYVD